MHITRRARNKYRSTQRVTYGVTSDDAQYIILYYIQYNNIRTMCTNTRVTLLYRTPEDAM